MYLMICDTKYIVDNIEVKRDGALTECSIKSKYDVPEANILKHIAVIESLPTSSSFSLKAEALVYDVNSYGVNLTFADHYKISAKGIQLLPRVTAMLVYEEERE